LPRNRLAGLLSGHRPRAETIDAVVRELGISREWLMTGAGEMNDVGPEGETPARAIRLPVLGIASAAGSTYVAYEQPEPHEIEYITIPSSLHVVQVQGPSMAPVALHGQYLIVNRDAPEDGDLAVIVLKTGGIFYKRVSYQGNLVLAASVNPAPDEARVMAIKRSEIATLRKVVGVIYSLAR